MGRSRLRPHSHVRSGNRCCWRRCHEERRGHSSLHAKLCFDLSVDTMGQSAGAGRVPWEPRGPSRGDSIIDRVQLMPRTPPPPTPPPPPPPPPHPPPPPTPPTTP